MGEVNKLTQSGKVSLVKPCRLSGRNCANKLGLHGYFSTSIWTAESAVAEPTVTGMAMIRSKYIPVCFSILCSAASKVCIQEYLCGYIGCIYALYLTT